MVSILREGSLKLDPPFPRPNSVPILRDARIFQYPIISKFGTSTVPVLHEYYWILEGRPNLDPITTYLGRPNLRDPSLRIGTLQYC